MTKTPTPITPDPDSEEFFEWASRLEFPAMEEHISYSAPPSEINDSKQVPNWIYGV